MSDFSNQQPVAATKAKLRNVVGTAVAIKAAPGTLYGLTIVNNTAAACFVQLFDVATSGVTPGTTTPDLEFQVAANSSLVPALPACGVSFAAAISAISATAEGGGTGSATGVQVNALYL
jgi:hypothetical protein